MNETALAVSVVIMMGVIVIIAILWTKGIDKAMKHSMYQAYLANSGLDDTSPQGSEAWGKQIKFMVEAFGPALKEMGLVK